jgi:hypothetical protein
MKYLKYLNRHQREIYCHHVPVEIWTRYAAEAWCYQTFGGKRKRWQAVIAGDSLSDITNRKCYFLFRQHADAMLFQLRWR